jgi:hypothetical protein
MKSCICRQETTCLIWVISYQCNPNLCILNLFGSSTFIYFLEGLVFFGLLYKPFSDFNSKRTICFTSFSLPYSSCVFYCFLEIHVSSGFSSIEIFLWIFSGYYIIESWRDFHEQSNWNLCTEKCFSRRIYAA